MKTQTVIEKGQHPLWPDFLKWAKEGETYTIDMDDPNVWGLWWECFLAGADAGAAHSSQGGITTSYSQFCRQMTLDEEPE